MRIYTVTYWIKNILGAVFLIAGIWMFLFFEPSKTNNEILKQYHSVIAMSLFPLGAVVVGGIENLLRMLIGLSICIAGILALAYFINHRDTWLGQLITSFGAPAMVFFGIVLMLMFNNKPNKR